MSFESWYYRALCSRKAIACYSTPQQFTFKAKHRGMVIYVQYEIAQTLPRLLFQHAPKIILLKRNLRKNKKKL